MLFSQMFTNINYLSNTILNKRYERCSHNHIHVSWFFVMEVNFSFMKVNTKLNEHNPLKYF